MILPKIESIGIYNSNIDRPNTYVSKTRKTAMFELELPIEDGGISYINAYTSPIKKDTFICAKPNQTRHTRFPFKCYYIHLVAEDNFIHEILSGISDFTNIKNYDFYKSIFEEICKYSNTFSQQDELILQSLLLKLIYNLSKETKAENLGKSNIKYNTAISNALKYISQNITEDLTLNKIAEHVSMSPVHFHNCFKTALGKTLHNYVEDERIKKSVNLMQTTDMTLTEIAYLCGFSSQSYYSYVFKRKMHTTPRKYIQKLNNNYNL